MRARYLAISLLLVYFALGVVLAEEMENVNGSVSENNTEIVNATEINEEQVEEGNISVTEEGEVTNTTEETEEVETTVTIGSSEETSENETEVENETLVANETEVEEGATEEVEAEEETVEEVEEIKPPEVKRPVEVCSEYIQNLKEVKEMAKEQFREKIGRELDYIKALVVLAGMNATIEKGEEYEVDVSQLVELRDEFMDKMDEINETDSKEELKELAKGMISIATEFKKVAHEIPELVNNSQEVMAAVKEAMKQEKEKHKGKLEEKWELAEKASLAVLDLHICLAQEKINRFYNLGFNITLAQEKLDEIKDLRDDLEAAYDSGNRTEVIKTKILIAKKWGEFHRAFIRLNARAIAYKYVKEKQKIVGLIQKLEEKGVDTSKLKNKLKVLDKEIKSIKKVKDVKELHKFSNEFNKMKGELEKIKKPIPVPPKKIQKKVLPPKKF